MRPTAPSSTDLDALVEILRETHRALGAVAQLLRRFLLERARGERRRGILAALAALDLGDVEMLARLEVVENSSGRRLVWE